ncbi:aspartate/glutamate racemase family protein [uncultured Corynebacterium sp.]|uniref:aspartate/glutamate racemase family protein n=1 Tax=uncultured Corynebacterium sp. TaxID=159447 RepID=UPI0025FE757A|nr:aspartate/glutamate racemase family protein [uncultured Corynebacterium sp.]
MTESRITDASAGAGHDLALDPGPAPTIVILNVNSTESMTEAMVASATRVAGAARLVGLTPAGAPACVETHADAVRSAAAMLAALDAYDGPLDAVVLAGVGDGGVDALRETLPCPVVDVTEAAAMTAMSLGDSFSFVTTVPRAIGMIRDRLRVAGLESALASVRASGLGVLELHGDGVTEALISDATAAIDADGAEVVCLGCCGMAGMSEEVSRAVGVPVVDPVRAGVAVAAGLLAQGLTTSRVRHYAPAPAEAAPPTEAAPTADAAPTREAVSS